MLTMSNTYEKINLRKFRHEFTQLKDSISAGQVFQVVEKSLVLGYFIPARYQFKILNKSNTKLSRQNLLNLRGIYKEDMPLNNNKDYKDHYRKILKKKYKI